MTITKAYRLYLFDLDGTLAPMDGSELYPDAAQWLQDNPAASWMIVTNQGGIGLRLWMETGGFGDPSKYPTLDSFRARIVALFPEPMMYERKVIMCARYQSKKSGEWSPLPEKIGWMSIWHQEWRKPAPGMLRYAMSRKEVAPEHTLMIGDSDEDQQAAAAAGCDFMWAHEFFGREKAQS